MCSHLDYAHLGAEEEPVAPRTRPVVLSTGEIVQEVLLVDDLEVEVEPLDTWEAEPERRLPGPSISTVEALRKAYDAMDLLETWSPAVRRFRDAQGRGDRRVRWSNHTRFDR